MTLNGISYIFLRATGEQKKCRRKRRTCNMQKSCQRVYFVANVVDKRNKCIHVLHKKERRTVCYIDLMLSSLNASHPQLSLVISHCERKKVRQRKEREKKLWNAPSKTRIMLNKLHRNVMMTPHVSANACICLFFSLLLAALYALFDKALVETYVFVVWIYEYKLLLYTD